MSDQAGAPRIKIETDIIASNMDDQLKRNALDFVAHMKANEMATDTNHFTYAGDYICQIILFTDNGVPGWIIFMGGLDSVLCRKEYQEFPADRELKEFAWAHVNRCDNHGCGTEPGKRVTLFGKSCENLCTAILLFKNPEGETLEKVKKLADVWAQSNAHAEKNDKPYVPGANERLSAEGFGAGAGRPLDKAYTKSLDVRFYVTPRRRYVNDAAFGFSGGGWVPSTPEQIPVALHIGGHSARFRANKEPASGWAAAETLKYQVNATYYVEMKIDVADGKYSVTIWMLDANGDIDTPYIIAKDSPFRFGGYPAVPAITAIDTLYMGSGGGDGEFVIKDFQIIGGE